MDKDLLITVLESIDLNGCNFSREQKEAFLEAIKSLKKGSKSWKGYRRFKNKYVVLNNAINQYADEMLSMDASRDNLTWQDATDLFWKYFQKGDSDGAERETS